ncbi:MAG: endolytic transglycosylase MltG, partial [Actinobacteria bacterium]|nr:endolytic transglycosylase MltG [Actinomycetota bacterium]
MRRRDRARRRRERKEIDARLEAVRPSDPSPKKRSRPRPKRRRRRRKSPARRLTLVALVLFVAVYGVYLLVSVAFYGGGEPVTVVVDKGDTLSSVADKLEEAGVIWSSTLFQLEARLQDEETEVKAGEYE